MRREKVSRLMYHEAKDPVGAPVGDRDGRFRHSDWPEAVHFGRRLVRDDCSKSAVGSPQRDIRAGSGSGQSKYAVSQ